MKSTASRKRTLTQANLFDVPAIPPPAPEFIKTGGVYGKCGSQWHHASGYSIQHCGHPTAHRPYYIVDPSGNSIYAEDGRAFWNLESAKKHLRSLVTNHQSQITNH